MVFEIFILIKIEAMEKNNHHASAKRKSSNAFPHIKSRKSQPDKKIIDKDLMHKIFHPDYILFDWEFFSRELEFE
jgi:hypothetical protein